MKKYLYMAFISAGAALLNSCTTEMYVSNAVNAPLLKEKGEVQVNVTQNDLQAAVAVGDHFGLMLNGFYKGYKDGNYNHNGVLGEFGLGYFQRLENNFVFETFAGAGVAGIRKQKEFTSESSAPYIGKFNAEAMKVFLQPEVGYKSRVFDAVISSRFSFVKYRNFSSQNYPQDELRKDYLDNDNLTGPTFIFAEPALTFRLGYKYIKLQAQYGLTINLTGNNIRHPNNFSSLGIVVDIARWYN